MTHMDISMLFDKENISKRMSSYMCDVIIVNIMGLLIFLEASVFFVICT